MDEVLSNHIIGTEMTYVITSQTATTFTFTVQTRIFRDAIQPDVPQGLPPVPPEELVEIAIYRSDGSIFQMVGSSIGFEVLPDGPEDALELGNNICFDTELLDRFGAGVTSYTSQEITLDIINEDYLIAFQRCCRQSTLLNIVDPGGTGSVTSTIISTEAQQQMENSSPVFNNDPEIVLCNQIEQIIDVSASDVNNDDLVYSFYRPETAGGIIGDPCNDGNPNTINDVLNNNCVCEGTLTSGTICVRIDNGADDVEQNGNNWLAT